MKRIIFTAALLVLTSPVMYSQSFSSGSTGADGALDLSTGNSNPRVVQLPDSGILNYTTVNIPVNATLVFQRNVRNTPVIMLVQGNVTIAGTINISAIGQTPGVGGFYGGPANFGGNLTPGFGPGGGQPNGERNGQWVGSLSLVPIIGGSGGTGGQQCTFAGQSPYGGGGGGAIVIASSQSITLSATSNIFANGAGPECIYGGAGGGSGGAIRLVANSLNVSGSLSALGANAYYSPNAYNGVVRMEAPSGFLTFTGTSNPAAVLSTVNSAITPTAAPVLTITSVGGFAVPSYSGSRLDTVDLLLPSQLTDPIAIGVQGSNIPIGTQVTVQSSGSPNATTTTCTLSGSLASSSCICNISALSRTAVTYVLAIATFNPPTGAQNFNAKGSNFVAKVRIESGIGTKPKLLFLRKDGSEIDQSKLTAKFLKQFGL